MSVADSASMMLFSQCPQSGTQAGAYRPTTPHPRTQHPAARRPCAPACALQQQQLEGIPVQHTARPWLPLNQPALWQGTEEQALDSTSCFSRLSPTWKVALLSDGSVTRHLQLLTGQPVSVECLEMVNIGSSLEGLPDAASSITGPRVQRTVLLRPRQQHKQRQTPRQEPSTTKLANTDAQARSSTSAQSVEVSESSHAAQRSGYSGQPVTASHEGSQPSMQGVVRQASQSSTQGVGSNQLSTDTPAAAPLVYAVSWWDAGEVDRYLSDRSKPIWVSLSQGHVELFREVQSVHCGHNTELEQLLGCAGPFWGRKYLFWHNDKPLTLIYEVFSPRLEQYLGPTWAEDWR